MSNKKSRLKKAELAYCDALHEWLTNPKNEELPNEITEAHIKQAFDMFLAALLLDEDECAAFISEGAILDEQELLPRVFDHFKSEKIYAAIKKNCEIAFSHTYSTESEEQETRRRALLAHMACVLGYRDH